MLKRVSLLLIAVITLPLYGQDFSALWEGYFSYFEIIDISQGNNKIFAASENAIFSYDIDNSEIETITTVNGLSGETISTIVYSEEYELLIVGYENGLIEIVFDNDENILSVVDILEKITISPDAKRVNHFNEFEGVVYISTDFGISLYDLDRLEFGDSYFIGLGGTQININQTAIFDNSIYAACGDDNAIKKGSLDNPNLIDSQQWQTIGNGNFNFISSVDNSLYAINSNRILFELVNDNLLQRLSYPIQPQDFREVNGTLLTTTGQEVFSYDSNLSVIQSVGINQDFNTKYNSATVISNITYIATRDFGVLKVDPQSEFEELRPEGPLRNDAYKIETGNNEIWVTYGDYTVSFNPSPVRQYGISHLVGEEWTNIPFDSVLGALNLNYTSINPFNNNQVFISSFQSGLLELNNEVPTVLYNESNSGLESLIVPNNPSVKSIRVAGTTFDREGLLWSISSRIDSPLKSYNPATGQWRSFSFSDLIQDPLNDELGFQEIVIGSDNTKWVAGHNFGLIAYNENNSDVVIRNINTEEQGMPSPFVKALALDNRNQLWIGTLKGIRVLFNTASFFEDPNPIAREIVFVDDGIPKELLAGQFITDIKVDASNNKWVGTLDSGVFYFSPNGQETIFHFTTDNSPLPSNNVNDIAIDRRTGKVYFATTKGLVSFLSGGSEVSDELADAYVYPNPVRPEYDILGSNNLNDINLGVKVKGLTENVNIKITDIEGNLVAEAQSSINRRSSAGTSYNFAIDGGTAIWNGKNLSNNIVSSGVYLFMISDLDSFETKVLKLVIIRK